MEERKTQEMEVTREQEEGISERKRREEMVYGLVKIFYPKERAVLHLERVQVWRRTKGKGSGEEKSIRPRTLAGCK